MTLKPFPSTNILPELEVSITHRCTLACQECGFLIPNQPIPHEGDVHQSIIEGLRRLLTLGVVVQRLVIVGGEPTLARDLLRTVCEFVRDCKGIDEVEVVTNGLTPDRVKADLLRLFDRLVISEYLDGPELVDAWRTWAEQVAPRVTVIGRRHDSWDRWNGDAEVSARDALKMWRSCWYRKHCITLERGRIFSCSRIPKLENDDEGLRLNENTTLEDIRQWLNIDRALPSCATCIPMMDFAPVPVGVQPDNRLDRLAPRALRILSERTEVR